MPEPCPVCQAFGDTICLGGKRHAERDVTDYTCGYCGGDCSAGYAQVKMVEVKRNRAGDLVDCETVGERMRCDPPCEDALEEARAILASLEENERRPAVDTPPGQPGIPEPPDMPW